MLKLRNATYIKFLYISNGTLKYTDASKFCGATDMFLIHEYKVLLLIFYHFPTKSYWYGLI